MASSMLQDERIQWIRQRVVISLEIPVESFNDHFTDSLERARSAGLARVALTDFLTKKHNCGSTLFFASEKWTEEVESMYLVVFVVHMGYSNLTCLPFE